MTTLLIFEKHNPYRDTRERAIEIHRLNPCISYADIGKALDVSRERIRQICGNRGTHISELRRTYPVVVHCEKCGKEKKIPPNVYRLHIKRGFKHFFCDNSCEAKYRWIHGDKTWGVYGHMWIRGHFQRNLDIYYWHCLGVKQKQLCAEYGLSQGRIAIIISAVKARLQNDAREISKN